MASSFDSSSHHFEVQVHPSTGAGHGKTSGKANRIIEALQPTCRLEGWFLPAQGTSVHGMRVLLGKQTIAVKRKQIRPDIQRRYAEHPDALLSGFKAALHLPQGLNELKLQFKDADKEWHDISTWQVRLPALWRVKKAWSERRKTNAYEHWLQEYETPPSADLADLREKVRHMSRPPLISLILPVAHRADKLLQRTLDSLKAQVYPHWELCVREGTGFVEKAARSDKRIKMGGAATGDYGASLEPGDALAPHALYHFAEALLRKPELDLLYCDEDVMDEQGKHHSPRMKGAWNYELLLHTNAVGQLLLLRSSLLGKLGEGTRWEKLLRAAPLVPRKNILHLPRVLFHQTQSDPALHDAPGDVSRIIWPLPSPAPLVSIIIPTRNRADLLRVAMESLFAKTKDCPYEIIIVDHASDEAESLAYFKSLSDQHANVRVVRAEGPFNWSRLNNIGAREAKGEIFLFLNNDVEITEGGWLRELASNAWRKDVGAVGACLLYPDGSIQHAGIVLGMTGLAGHAFRTAAPQVETIGGSPALPREVTAVTGACLAVRRSVFNEVGGFDEDHLPISYNDVDFCLKLRAQGLRNLYTPFARLIHHESVSRRDIERESVRKTAASEEAHVMLKRWPGEFQQDAFYSPNLSLDHEIPALGDPPPRLLSGE